MADEAVGEKTEQPTPRRLEDAIKQGRIANSAEVQRLKDAAMPLLFQMREDQKQEVRKFAQLIGLSDVASMI